MSARSQVILQLLGVTAGVEEAGAPGTAEYQQHGQLSVAVAVQELQPRAGWEQW